MKRIYGVELGNIERRVSDPFDCHFEIIFWYCQEDDRVEIVSPEQEGSQGLLAVFGSLPAGEALNDLVACIQDIDRGFNSISRWEWAEMHVLSAVLEKIESKPDGEMLNSKGMLPFMVDDELADILYDLYIKTVPTTLSIFDGFGIKLSSSLILDGRNSPPVENHCPKPGNA